MNHNYALIMAGGAGTRLWPLSRQKRPKPLLSLVDTERSMLQISVERLQPLFPPENILIVTGQDMIHLVREQLSNLPAANFIVEPVGRDSAPALGLGAIHIRQRDSEAVIAVLTADHYIADEARFRDILQAACELAAEDQVVTLGITPTFAATGFGYIERGAQQRVIRDNDIYDLKRFVEKPDQATAKEFLSTGSYYWNSGMFIWPVGRVMDEFARHAPDLSASLERLAAALDQPDYPAVLASIWPDMRRISVDFALMEHIHEQIAVIPTEIGWSDIGNFEALYDILSEDDNHVISGHSPLLVDSKRMLIFSQRLVATIGLEDLVIIDTPDALLICPRSRAQDIKQIVENLKITQRNEYL